MPRGQQVERNHRKPSAIVDEEVELGLRTIAVPIRSTTGTVVAALVIALRSNRMAVEDMPARLLPLMAPAQEAMKQIA